VLHATLEYVSFMVVVGSFFVVAGGIHLRVPGQERPALNALFLLGGALLGNIIGTTGASMLLIRPWIAMNRDHFGGIHIAFFIFTVSNIRRRAPPGGPAVVLDNAAQMSEFIARHDHHLVAISFGRHLVSAH
jgi:Putative citrate transport